MVRKQTIYGVSFLLVLIGSLLLLYAQTFSPSTIFPQDTELWNKIITGYLVIFSIVLTATLILAPKVIKALVKTNYWDGFFKRFIPSFLLSITILMLLKSIIKGAGGVDIFEGISYMNIAVLLFHLIIVAQIEELLFGGLLFTSVEVKYGKRTANIITAVLFGGWHFAKTSGNLIMMVIYIPLRLIFNYLRNNGYPLLNRIAPNYFGASPRTQQTNAGAHAGWNAFIVGFIQPIGI